MKKSKFNFAPFQILQFHCRRTLQVYWRRRYNCRKFVNSWVSHPNFNLQEMGQCFTVEPHQQSPPFSLSLLVPHISKTDSFTRRITKNAVCKSQFLLIQGLLNMNYHKYIFCYLSFCHYKIFSKQKLILERNVTVAPCITLFDRQPLIFAN